MSTGNEQLSKQIMCGPVLFPVASPGSDCRLCAEVPHVAIAVGPGQVLMMAQSGMDVSQQPSLRGWQPSGLSVRLLTCTPSCAAESASTSHQAAQPAQLTLVHSLVSQVVLGGRESHSQGVLPQTAAPQSMYGQEGCSQVVEGQDHVTLGLAGRVQGADLSILLQVSIKGWTRASVWYSEETAVGSSL